MIVLLNAWVEVVDVNFAASSNYQQGKYSLALGKDPLNTALLLPVAAVAMEIKTTGFGPPGIESLFNAQGTMWAAKTIAIDFQESGDITIDADLHLDWTVGFVDWFTWFVSWNQLEGSPDGSLVDGERAYG